MTLNATQELWQQVLDISGWEWIAVVTGIVQVLLAWRNNVLLYPFGIVSTACSIYVLGNAGLFAEAFLNGYYLVMSVYGWLHWMRRRTEPELPVTRSTRPEWLTTAGIVITGTLLLYFVLSRFTPSDVPLWDAWVSATAWAGMWLLARRKLENWLLLNISNLFAIPLQFHKGIPAYAILTIILFIVAIFGYLRWQNICRMQDQRS